MKNIDQELLILRSRVLASCDNSVDEFHGQASKQQQQQIRENRQAILINLKQQQKAGVWNTEVLFILWLGIKWIKTAD